MRLPPKICAKPFFKNLQKIVGVCIAIDSRKRRSPTILKENMKPDALAEPAPDELCALICAGLDDDLAQDITQLDLAGKTSIADYMVIATGRSARHVGALANHLIERLKKIGLRDIRMEGKQQGDWVLIDAGYVIVHLFRAEIRTHYDLEKLWTTPYQDQEQTAAITAAQEADTQEADTLSDKTNS